MYSKSTAISFSDDKPQLLSKTYKPTSQGYCINKKVVMDGSSQPRRDFHLLCHIKEREENSDIAIL